MRRSHFQILKRCHITIQRTLLFNIKSNLGSRHTFSGIISDYDDDDSSSCWNGMSQSTRDLALSMTTDNGPIYRRLALSRAITLIESKRPQKKQQAELLLEYLLSKHRKEGAGNEEPTSLRIGFAGPPGAGKSSLIEAFGMYLLENDPKLQLAAVCIDPASEISGGSILGDKTRMTLLSRCDRAYVRPSSNAGVLGGLAAYTDDVVTTLSAAGYPIVLLETVGLGQSEIEVAQSVDILILLLPPGGGDELQGVKKGIVELAHILAVTKADGDLLPAARATAADYRGAIKVLQQSSSNNKSNVWNPSVLLTSAVTNEGLDKLWEAIQEYKNFLSSENRWPTLRQQQAKYWMWKQFKNLVQERIQNDPELGKAAKVLETELLHGELTPRVAAKKLSDSIFSLKETKEFK